MVGMDHDAADGIETEGENFLLPVAIEVFSGDL